MASLRWYTIIYFALVALATGKFVAFELPQFTYEVALGITLVLAVIKVGLIAGYYQHLVDEPRSLTYLMASAGFAVFLLTIAAGYSIT